MTKSKTDPKWDSQHHSLSLRRLSSMCSKVCRFSQNEKKSSQKKEWEDAVCSVCLEFPHNAVLLLCSSYDKGCRPYMCATSHQLSNCLEQYIKTTKSCLLFGCELSGVSCPLCRGEVKGCTVVEPARSYLNGKKRACMQEGCSFVGCYKEIEKHVKFEHPLACPRDVDPLHAEKWKKLESEREFNDVLSTITSTMPGAIVVGDYVVYDDFYYDEEEEDEEGTDYDDDMNNSFFTQARVVGHGASFHERSNPLQGGRDGGAAASAEEGR